MLEIGEEVKYHNEIYVILDETPDGSLIIGKQNNCENEVKREEVIAVIDDKQRI